MDDVATECANNPSTVLEKPRRPGALESWYLREAGYQVGTAVAVTSIDDRPRPVIAKGLTSRRIFNVTFCLTFLFGANACASLPRSTPAGARTAGYLAAHPELAGDVSRAIENGRLLLGMSTEQVAAVIGEPDRRTRWRELSR